MDIVAQRLRMLAPPALLVATGAWWTVVLALSVPLISERGSDFADYYDAAAVLAVHPHANIYDWGVLAAVGCPTFPHAGYVYLPLLAILVRPLLLLPCDAALVLWRALSGACWIGSAALLARWLPGRGWPPRLAMAAALVACYGPAIYGLWLGQVHLIALCALLGALA